YQKSTRILLLHRIPQLRKLFVIVNGPHSKLNMIPRRQPRIPAAQHHNTILKIIWDLPADEKLPPPPEEPFPRIHRDRHRVPLLIQLTLANLHRPVRKTSAIHLYMIFAPSAMLPRIPNRILPRNQPNCKLLSRNARRAMVIFDSVSRRSAGGGHRAFLRASRNASH